MIVKSEKIKLMQDNENRDNQNVRPQISPLAVKLIVFSGVSFLAASGLLALNRDILESVLGLGGFEGTLFVGVLAFVGIVDIGLGLFWSRNNKRL